MGGTVMKIFVYILSITALVTGGCVSSSHSLRSSFDSDQVEKIAIVAVEGAVTSDTAKDQIADIFAMELLDRGYSPIGMAQVRAKLREQELESAELTTIEAAVEAGLILKVPAVMVVDIPHFHEEIAMTAKLIDVEDGSIIWMGKNSGRTGRSASGSLMGVITGTGTPGSSRGGYDNNMLMSGPIAELFSGEVNPALTPAQEQKIQRIVRYICSSLPIRSTTSW
jgi:hypothetical protein